MRLKRSVVLGDRKKESSQETPQPLFASYRVPIRLLPLCREVRSVADVRGHVSRRVPGARKLRDRSSCGMSQQRRLQTPHRNGCLRTSTRIGHSQNRVRLRRSARQLQRGHRPSDELRSPCIPYDGKARPRAVQARPFGNRCRHLLPMCCRHLPMSTRRTSSPRRPMAAVGRSLLRIMTAMITYSQAVLPACLELPRAATCRHS